MWITKNKKKTTKKQGMYFPFLLRAYNLKVLLKEKRLITKTRDIWVSVLVLSLSLTKISLGSSELSSQLGPDLLGFLVFLCII